MNYLKAVFWDCPEFADKRNIEKYIQEKKGSVSYLWVLKRFLEYGRVVDTLTFFNIEEISDKLPKLKLSPYARKKWRRIIEVYNVSRGS